jgi:hypothetical protein
VSCVVRPFNTIVGSAAINESILSMKSMPADGKSNSVTGRNRHSSCKGGKCATSGSGDPWVPDAYSISASAVASSDDGTSRPSALAVLRFITSSNFVGCSMGRSAGFAPLKILSAKLAARR